MEFQQLVDQANHIRSLVNDLRTAAYTEYKFELDSYEYSFYASFDVEEIEMVYNVLRDGIEIKLLSDLSPTIFIRYSDFVRDHEAWVAGHSPRPEYTTIESGEPRLK